MQIGDYVDATDLNMKIDSLTRPNRGSTNIYVALVTMRGMFQSDHRFDGEPYKRSIAIVITDGVDSHFKQVQSEASAAHADGIAIISIGKSDATQVRSSSMFKVVSQLTLLIDNSSYNNLVRLPIHHAIVTPYITNTSFVIANSSHCCVTLMEIRPITKLSYKGQRV